MTVSDLGRTIAAIACTIVFSSVAVIGAVGPATAGTTPTVAAAPTISA